MSNRSGLCFPLKWNFTVFTPDLCPWERDFTVEGYPGGVERAEERRAANPSWRCCLATSLMRPAVSFFEFTHDDDSRGRGCDSHPNVLTHQVMADQLVPVIKAKTGW